MITINAKALVTIIRDNIEARSPHLDHLLKQLEIAIEAKNQGESNGSMSDLACLLYCQMHNHTEIVECLQNVTRQYENVRAVENYPTYFSESTKKARRILLDNGIRTEPLLDPETGKLIPL